MSNLEASNLFSVKGVVAVVTGGGSGKLLFVLVFQQIVLRISPPQVSVL